MTTPLVSCIMPTANRRRFVPQAIKYFLAQDYADKELIVLDDGEDIVSDLIPDHPQLHYRRLEARQPLGAKRNLACEMAQGEIIAHWDDDDWHSPTRLSQQVEALIASGTDVCGLDQVLFVDPAGQRAFEYVYPKNSVPWVCGGTLCFHKAFWRHNPFPQINVGEDTRFIFGARGARVCALPDNTIFVGLIHDANTCRRQTHDPRWQPRPIETIRVVTGGDWPNYANAPAVLAAAPIDADRRRTLTRLQVDHPVPSRIESPEPNVVSRAMRQGVSVVVPHGGTERLPQLAASLVNLWQCSGVDEIIVVDMGAMPIAQRLARRWGAKYVFARNDGVFERARALNVGSGLATYDLVLWKDNDLLMPSHFVEAAAGEFRHRGLDFLIPYAVINYLSEIDSKAVMEGVRDPARCRVARTLMPGGQVSGGAGLVRKDFLRLYGGIPEGFRGWGGEDNAWAHKVALLGRSAICTNGCQRLFHLYHGASGAHDATVHRKNPHYADNLSLLARIISIRDKRQFLELFPASSIASCPWDLGKRIVFVAPQAGDERNNLAQLAAEGLRELLAVEVAAIEGREERWLADLAGLAPDAVVLFDQACGLRLLAQEDLALLHNKAVVVVDTVAKMPAFDARLLERAAALVFTEDFVGASVPAQIPTFTLPANGAAAADIGAGLVQPLSIILGDARTHASGPGESAAPKINGASSMSHPVWIYWEGECPEWITACQRTIRAHAPDVRLLDRDGFERIRDRDRDIDIDRLQVAHRADFIRAFLLARYGGLWLDSDCIVAKPLAPLLDLLNAHDFIAHRDRQGLFPNGFIGARAGSVIAGEFYRRICAILRSGQPLGWISLGGKPLTELLKSTDVPWHELQCELIQPVCWSRPDVFFTVTCRDNHERSFNDRAFCYMLSNTEIKKYAAEHPKLALMQDGSFFRFLLERSASTAVSEEAAGVTAQGLVLTRASERRSAAKHRYRNTKLAAEHLSFFLSSIAELSPARVLEVGIELGRWGMLIGDWGVTARHESGGAAPHLHLHGIELSPDTVCDRRHSGYQAVSKGDFQAPLDGEDRHWDVIVVADALNVWPPDGANHLIGKAMEIADYVLIWEWREVGPDRSRGGASEIGAQQTWLSAVRASRVGTVDNCRYGAFLLSHTDPRDVQRAAAIEQLFEKVFRDNSKIGDESVSGPGSCLAQTAEIRRGLPYLLQSLEAKSLLDAPCGDFNWMKYVVLGLNEYIGADIVYDLVVENQRKYGGGGRRFIKADVTRDDLPETDVILCRDCLVHLSFEALHRAMQNFKRSAATYLLTTTFPRLQTNSDIVTGGWRPLNLQLAPFNFPNPIRIIVEGCTEAGGRYADKSLGLWRLSDIA